MSASTAGSMAGSMADIAEASLPTLSGLVARWRGDDSYITLSGGDVSGWADFDAGTHNLAQGVAASQPTRNVREINGRGTARFCTVAGSEHMTAADHADLDMGQLSFMVIMVLQRANVGGAFKVAWAKGTSVSADNLRGFIDASSKLKLFWGNDGQAYTESTATAPDDTPCLLGWGIDAPGTQAIYMINGAVERKAVTLSGTGANALEFRVGGDAFQASYQQHPFDLAEMLVYQRDGATGWTDAELQSIYTYAQSRYAL